ncbi:hypothetical protein Poli38472_011966 [Pythium oligandrum]|uniref:Uncharacterized protein n=1 Tax=Pythium oligandrum TaxID=41045 RepID=A0A8K1CNZ9_PYTOL|nr:hypothetical protein Poli38472_011966 [Pythium oligandrum]|eukprot:TMW66850.1 hypothetical protein Poli38472_011966 [Pythium oligandrum]
MRAITVHPVVAAEASRISSRSLSSRLNAFSVAPSKAFLRIVSVLTGFGRIHQRYTVAKLHEFEHYRQTTSLWRVVGILLSTPVLGFLGTLFPVWIPLQDPRLGFSNNPGSLVHYFLMVVLATLGATLIPRACIGFTREQFSRTKVGIIVGCVAVSTTGVYAIAASIWRFPVLFAIILSSAVFCPSIILCHSFLLKDLLAKSSPYRKQLLGSVPWVVVRCSQIVIYPAFTALFEVVDAGHQILLTLAFPILKHCIKTISRKVGKGFNDFNEEMAVTGVEISASLYQSMLMQSTPSLLTTAIIIMVDVVHGLLGIKVFMDKPSIVTRHAVLETALRHIEKSRLEKKSVTWADLRQSQFRPTMASDKRKVMIEEQQLGDVVVIQALEILQAAENILFVEYFGVAIPIVNVIYLAIASQADSARYNPKLAPFHASNERLVDGVRAILVYSLLQSVTLLAMLAVMRYRYRLSTARLLSFILERHWWSLQGKMIGWLPLFLHFSLLHYGADFKFKFDIEHSVQDTESQQEVPS